jgi:hypothetical protein
LIYPDISVTPSATLSADLHRQINTPLANFTCYKDNCVLPFSWPVGAPELTHYRLQFIALAATGMDAAYLSSYDFSTELSVIWNEGVTFNCVTLSLLDSPMCHGYTVWKYGDLLANEKRATELYTKLYGHFHCIPDCHCVDISASCNSSLTSYACEAAYAVCAAAGDFVPNTGFQQMPCQSSCKSVQETCRQQFEDVGLGELSCNSNWYEGDCKAMGPPRASPTPTVGPTPPASDSGDDGEGLSVVQWMFIVAGMLASILLIAAVAVLIGNFAWKKWRLYKKHKLQRGGGGEGSLLSGEGQSLMAPTEYDDDLDDDIDDGYGVN